MRQDLGAGARASCYSKGDERLRDDVPGRMHSLAGMGWLPEAPPAAEAGRAGGRWRGDRHRPGKPRGLLKALASPWDGSQ